MSKEPKSDEIPAALQTVIASFKGEIAPQLAKEVIPSYKFKEYEKLGEKEKNDYDEKYKDFLTPKQAEVVANNFLENLKNLRNVVNECLSSVDVGKMKEQMTTYIDGLAPVEGQRGVGSFPAEKLKEAKKIITNITSVSKEELTSKDQNIVRGYQVGLQEYFRTAVNALDSQQAEYGKGVSEEQKLENQKKIKDSRIRNLRTAIKNSMLADNKDDSTKKLMYVEAFLQVATQMSGDHFAETMNYDEEQNFIDKIIIKKDGLINQYGISDKNDLESIGGKISGLEKTLAKKRFARKNKIIATPNMNNLFDEFIDEACQLASDIGFKTEENQKLISDLLWDRVQEHYTSQGEKITNEDKSFMQDLSFVFNSSGGEERPKSLKGFMVDPTSTFLPKKSEKFHYDLVKHIAKIAGKTPSKLIVELPDTHHEKADLFEEAQFDALTKNFVKNNFKAPSKSYKPILNSKLNEIKKEYGEAYFNKNLDKIAEEYTKALAGGRVRRFARRRLGIGKNVNFSEKDFAKAAAKMDENIRKTNSYKEHFGKQTNDAFRKMSDPEKKMFTEAFLGEVGELALKERSSKYLDAIFQDLAEINNNKELSAPEKINKNIEYVRTILESPMPDGKQSGAAYFAGKMGNKLIKITAEPAIGMIESRMKYDKNFQDEDLKKKLVVFAKNHGLIENKKEFDELLLDHVGLKPNAQDGHVGLNAGEEQQVKVPKQAKKTKSRENNLAENISISSASFSGDDKGLLQPKSPSHSYSGNEQNQLSDVENSLGNQSKESSRASSKRGGPSLSEQEVKAELTRFFAEDFSKLDKKDQAKLTEKMFNSSQKEAAVEIFTKVRTPKKLAEVVNTLSPESSQVLLESAKLNDVALQVEKVAAPKFEKGKKAKKKRVGRTHKVKEVAAPDMPEPQLAAIVGKAPNIPKGKVAKLIDAFEAPKDIAVEVTPEKINYSVAKIVDVDNEYPPKAAKIGADKIVREMKNKVNSDGSNKAVGTTRKSKAMKPKQQGRG